MAANPAIRKSTQLKEVAHTKERNSRETEEC
jgi:hypothetical protein